MSQEEVVLQVVADLLIEAATWNASSQLLFTTHKQSVSYECPMECLLDVAGLKEKPMAITLPSSSGGNNLLPDLNTDPANQSSGQNRQSANGQNNNNNPPVEAQNTTTTQTSVWDSFLSNLPTPADDYENPLYVVPGTQAYTTSKAKFDSYVDTVLVDPADAVTDADLPANYTSPTPQDFLNWHPSIQLRYLRDNFTEEQINNGQTYIGTGDGRIGVIRAQDKRSIIIVNELTKSTIFQLTKAEQTRVANNAVYKEKVSISLNLLPNNTSDLTTTRTILRQQIDAKINEINTKRFVLSATPTNVVGLRARIDAANNTFRSRAQELFGGQLELLKKRLDRSAIFSRTDLATEINAVMKRFERAFNYQDIIDPRHTRNSYISSDGNVTIRRGLEVYLEQEKRILTLKQSQTQMLDNFGFSAQDANGRASVSRLDVPSLVSFLQLQGSLQKEAIITARTEQLTQLNHLSQAYSEMQRIVNETLKKFTRTGNDAQDERHSLAVDMNSNSVPQYTKDIVHMFSTRYSATPHPVEKDYNISRPLQNMIGYQPGRIGVSSFTRTQWERFSTQLSDAVTQLNPQLLTNDINQDNREQNRIYEQATGTLRRAFDLNVQVARNI